MRLEDKVSIITGAGGGMGRVAALRFAAEARAWSSRTSRRRRRTRRLA